MTHCPGCTGEARASVSTYGHILGCGSTKECAGHDHKHTGPVLGAESPIGDAHVKKVLTVAATALSNKAGGTALGWQDVAAALRYALDKVWT